MIHWKQTALKTDVLTMFKISNNFIDRAYRLSRCFLSEIENRYEYQRPPLTRMPTIQLWVNICNHCCDLCQIYLSIFYSLNCLNLSFWTVSNSFHFIYCCKSSNHVSDRDTVICILVGQVSSYSCFSFWECWMYKTINHLPAHNNFIQLLI